MFTFLGDITEKAMEDGLVITFDGTDSTFDIAAIPEGDIDVEIIRTATGKVVGKLEQSEFVVTDTTVTIAGQDLSGLYTANVDYNKIQAAI